MEKIFVRETGISIQKNHNWDYISLTDIARYKNPTETALVISYWLSTCFTVDFLGIWETIKIWILILRNSVVLEMRVATFV